MNSKKVLALGMAAVMAAGMTGCSVPGEGGSTTTGSSTGTTAAAAAGESTQGGETAAADNNTTSATGLKVFRYATSTDPTSLDPVMGN